MVMCVCASVMSVLSPAVSVSTTRNPATSHGNHLRSIYMAGM